MGEGQTYFTVVAYFTALVAASSDAFQFTNPDGCGHDVSHSSVMMRTTQRAQSFCALRCSQDPSCQGFNWQREPENGVHSCELVDAASDEHGSHLNVNLGFSYMEKSQSGFQSATTTCRKLKTRDCLCPAGYSQMGCSCYKFNSAQTDFETAQASCRSDSPFSDIVSIDSAEETLILKQLVLSSESGDANQFTLHDAYDFDGDNQNYVHSSKGNATLSYINWSTNEPNNANELCVAFTPNSGVWFDVPCSWTTLQSICEIDKNFNGCSC
ncbi:uncharacterized protein LOC106157646 [Lingula anatina]|uniref:Uncharacterized protein LOC106157646 n=1 Tax=Lingula anatina TaxID=7574 RepID=A0A1S3HTD9_LINAN|nr:uncharacterized protein LOC106157646 [Lingula anatina]|eukprot:XP_013388816.1 uncharacterized protein LOC106157646 [Lingula anatina]